MEKVKIQFKKLYPDVKLPTQAYPGDAGFDVYACSYDERTNFTIKLQPNERVLVGCGFSMSLPYGWEAQVRPRSGLALKNGITVLNSPGTIDHSYTGQVGVILINHGKESVYIYSGDKIAQLVVAQVPQVEFEEVDELPQSERGQKGFGSSGT